jgi:hypothetical protein
VQAVELGDLGPAAAARLLLERGLVTIAPQPGSH